MSIEGLSEEDLAMLTPEERAGYEEDDDEDEGEGDGADNGDQGDGDPGDGGDGSDDDKGQGDNGKKSDDDAGADQGGDGADQGDGDDGEDEKLTPPPVPLFKADVPADIAAKRTALDEESNALGDKFDEGEITFSEYRKQQKVIDEQLRALDRAELKSELAQEALQSQSQTTWEATANAFVSEHPLISKNETTWGSFDAVLRRVTAETMTKGGQPGRRELEKAYKQWTEDLGFSDASTAKKEPEQKKKKEIVVPPTIGKIPAAAQNDTDDGKFAHLDRLADSDPLAFEAALAKMTEAQRDEYMQAG